jgi:cytochrome P450
MVIARSVTAAVMGLPNELVGPLVAVARAYQTSDSLADEAVATLVGALSRTPDEATAARIGVLVQACDATAGLIGNAAVSGCTIAETLRDDPPVRATRRLVDGSVRLVALTGVPFGAGPHACPGQEHAIAIACGVLDALAGWRVVVDEVAYEPSPTLRMPSTLPVVRRVS